MALTRWSRNFHKGNDFTPMLGSAFDRNSVWIFRCAQFLKRLHLLNLQTFYAPSRGLRVTPTRHRWSNLNAKRLSSRVKNQERFFVDQLSGI